MFMLIVLLFGIVSLTKLPVELYPNTSFGEISIIIQARGGIPPTEVETLVTKPVEEAVATVLKRYERSGGQMPVEPQEADASSG